MSVDLVPSDLMLALTAARLRAYADVKEALSADGAIITRYAKALVHWVFTGEGGRPPGEPTRRVKKTVGLKIIEALQSVFDTLPKDPIVQDVVTRCHILYGPPNPDEDKTE